MKTRLYMRTAILESTRVPHSFINCRQEKVVLNDWWRYGLMHNINTHTTISTQYLLDTFWFQYHALHAPITIFARERY